MESRVDVGAKTLDLYGNARDRIVPHFGDCDPNTVTPADIADVVAANRDLSSGSPAEIPVDVGAGVRLCRLLPNPVRSSKVKLPSGTTEEISPPSQADWNLIKKTSRRSCD